MKDLDPWAVALCALLAIVLWVACAGIGARILPRPTRRPVADDSDPVPSVGAPPPSWRQPGVAACVGLGALLLLGGFGVLLRIPWWLFVVPFLAAGLVLALVDVRGFASRRGSMPESMLILGAVGVVAIVAVALVESPYGLRFPLNACDDWRAYLPYAHRLLDTYGLEEPWSVRRVQSLGGFDLLRALPVSVFGDDGIGVAETVVACVFLAGLFVANGVRTHWARLLSIGFILAIPFFWIPRTNTTGVLIATPLLVAVYGATGELRSALRAGHLGVAVRWAVGAGLVIAALMSVRPNLGVLGGTVFAVGTLLATGVRPAGRLRALGAGVASGLVAFAPWSVAMWRTAGTPLYPLFSGNLVPAATRREAVHGIADLAEHTVDLMLAGPYVWVTIGVFVVVLIARRILPDAALVAWAAAATGGVTVAFALYTPSLAPGAFIRYVAPMAAGLAVFLLCDLLRGTDGLQMREPARASRSIVAVVGVVAGVALAGLAYSTIGNELVPFDKSAQLLVDAANNDLVPTPERITEPPGLRADFRRALRGLDPDRTIAAVDRPYLIDYRRADIKSLDAPGLMTPDGAAFPFFTGPRAKVARLRHYGYDTLVATDPVSDVCLTPVRLEEAARRRPADRRNYSRFGDWDHDVQAIAQKAPDAVRRFGPLLVVDLPRAQQALTAGTGP